MDADRFLVEAMVAVEAPLARGVARAMGAADPPVVAAETRPEGAEALAATAGVRPEGAEALAATAAAPGLRVRWTPEPPTRALPGTPAKPMRTVLRRRSAIWAAYLVLVVWGRRDSVCGSLRLARQQTNVPVSRASGPVQPRKVACASATLRRPAAGVAGCRTDRSSWSRGRSSSGGGVPRQEVIRAVCFPTVWR
jgi:hypothetical protein